MPASVSDSFDSGIQCRMEPNSCPDQMACADFDTNPNGGLLSFDSVGSVSIVILQAITADTWSEPMYAVMSSYSPYACIFFVVVAIVGGMFVANLFLAVLFEVGCTEVCRSRRRRRFWWSYKEPRDVTERPRSRGALASVVAAAQSCAGRPPHNARFVVAAPQEFMAKHEKGDDLSAGAPTAAPAATPCVSAASGSESTPPVDDSTALLLPKDHVSSDGIPSRPSNCCDCAPRAGWRKGLSRIVSHDYFTYMTTSLVLLNLVLMCMPYASMEQAYFDAIETATAFLTSLFVAEMLLKLMGLGCKGYWQDGWNKLDGTIVILSAADMLLVLLAGETQATVSYMRILRMLRVVR